MTEMLNVQIIKNEKICEDTFYMILELPFSYPASVPGQFVNLYLNNPSKMLPRPISIFDHKDHELHLVYAVVGNGTKEFSGYKARSSIRISTPLGNGFAIPEYIEDGDDNFNDILLTGGGMGIAPLHYLARIIQKKYRESNDKPNVYAVLGFKGTPFLADKFDKYCTEVQVSTEVTHEDCWNGNVITPITECKYTHVKNWFTCGPGSMQKALSALAVNQGITNIQVSLEERMGCGFGTCVGCSVNIKDRVSGSTQRRKVCKDGPVFNGNEVIW